MTQLTIRNFPEALEARIRELASERGWSLNKAVIFLLKKGAGLEETSQARVVGDRLKEFEGSWTEQEARGFERRTREVLETIEPELWK